MIPAESDKKLINVLMELKNKESLKSKQKLWPLQNINRVEKGYALAQNRLNILPITVFY